ncbi:hypothetical protein HG536_0H01480 [Torulaspora globosa]|uniref:Probable vacuolar protein sorting-associated protein 16 homolog n=1 Tax=Torulaspora globosa TaxID=48254 RepID=A0A7G3ZMN7_9SACH|nr:uncharacterized protein HG536_0H01480 [Torulaspora globosa]QLL34773.1 hypothetical protein HG536_0H01480 [Torulaspora globosa]
MKIPSFSWERLRDVFYRSRILCESKWPALDDVQYAISTTLIAIEVNEAIEIYDYQGELEATLDKKAFPDVVAFEFDENDNLIIATPNSIIMVRSWRPLNLSKCLLKDEVQDSIWDFKQSLLVTRQNQDIYRYQNHKIELICKNSGRYTLLTKEHWGSDRKKAVLLDVNHVFQLEIEDKLLSKSLQDSQWQNVVISPDGLICLYSSKFNKLQIYKDPQRILLEHSLDGVPKIIKWCGNDSIACSFTDEVRLYGPENSYVTFWYPHEISALFTEADGLKIFTEEDVRFISRVSSSTSNAFRVGSTEPAAILLDSLDLLDSNISGAIENLKIINLEKAVEDCIAAAKEEFDPHIQKQLLSAASFGKASLAYRSFDSDKFVHACDKIRLLNLLRGRAMFLTAAEFDRISLNGIIERLLVRHKHYHAIAICRLTKNLSFLPKVFSSWAITKLQLSPELEDDELLSLIKEKFFDLQTKADGHMARVAHAAFLEGRFRLARDLALLEPSTTLKISELLGLEDDNLALTVSMEARSPELTLSLLLSLRERLTTTQLIRLLTINMSNEQLYPYYNRKYHSLLYDYYRQMDQYVDLAQLLIAQAKQQGSLRAFLPQVRELYSKIPNNPLTKENTELLLRQEKLYTYQDSLSSKYGQNFIDMSLDETLSKLIDLRQERQAQDLVKRFNVTDKKFYHLKCKRLIENKLFEDLYEFAISRKSPIGYRPFYNYLKRKGYNAEAVNYVDMISGISYKQKWDLYLECKGYYEAIRLAGKEKDVLGLKELYRIVPANEPRLKAEINQIMSKL